MMASCVAPIRCGGISDSTGDLVFGDRNGIVVIPEHAAKEVLGGNLRMSSRFSRAAEIEAMEETHAARRAQLE
jgi:regulator of RNase E activity RraA